MGQHSVLASDMMRARIRGDADLAQAANAALGQNTEAMARVVQPFVDAPAQKHFTEMWAEHILALFDYARGHSIHDPAVREDAREESVEYEGELAEFFVDHSGGRLDRRLARVAVHDHAQHLLANADAYAAGRYASAAQGYRDSYAHSYDFGATLARALMPSTVTRALDTPSVRLRSALTGLLGEHAALVLAMTRSAAGAPGDVAAMGRAVLSAAPVSDRREVVRSPRRPRDSPPPPDRREPAPAETVAGSGGAAAGGVSRASNRSSVEPIATSGRDSSSEKDRASLN